MRIAVAYNNGEVNGHFGQTEQFKLYSVEDGQVLGSTVVDSEGEGHSALASFLAAFAVDAVICGGIGDGAQNALSAAGIEVVSGVEGDADKAVESYLKGEITSAGVNCQKEESGEGCGCGGNCGEGCGSEEGGCGGCGGGCGGCGGRMQPLFEGPNVGKACVVNYKGTFNDGTCFDSSFERGEPIQFICGVGMMIPGFDKAVATMNIGETVDIHLMPEEAYGPVDPNMVFDLKISQLPGSENLSVGESVFLGNAYGQQFPVTVVEKTEDSIKLDANHEMAGKELNFTIELVDVLEE